MGNHCDIGNFMEDNPCKVCGNLREMHTSWTTINPERRFISCPNDSCKDFAWFDPPMCARSVQIIPGLLRRGNRMEAKITRSKAREKKFYVALTMT
ncbi:hypothetical protein Vadar_012358 [Vaccinium darrowii]|uniref:Uncharacterized protein n=1 Tax=Vaccinium darrowii TaxID=229202 RepID=A0ACB7WZX0_9ERIC|nr:hypothetical protein Vadar_012358 [Vaccinium darrowii]